jgi:peptidyl-dipeptidase A
VDSSTPDEQARQFADEFAAATSPIETELLRQLFVLFSTGEALPAATLSRQLAEIYSARRPHAQLTRWVEQVREPFLRRRLAMLRQRFTDHQSDPELQRRLLERLGAYLQHAGADAQSALPYRHPVDCGEPLWPMLREPDRERRREQFVARHAAPPERAEALAELLSLRARLLADRATDESVEFDPEHHIHESEQNSVPAAELLDRLRLETEAPYAEILERRRAGLGISALQWWDLYCESPEQPGDLVIPPARALVLARETFKAIGLRLEDLPIVLTLDRRPELGQRAYRFPVHVPDDVQVLVSFDDEAGRVDLLVHELGHAVYSSLIEQECWEFRAPAGASFAEAIAQLFSRLCRQPEWLTRMLGLDEQTALERRQRMAENELIRLRTVLLLARFESEAPGHGAKELDELWRGLAGTYLRVGAEAHLYPWASVRHLALHPRQLQNRAIAELIAAQLWSHYTRHLGPLFPNDALGRRLARDIFRHGARYPWPQLLLKLTGRQLGTESYVRQLVEELRL